MAREPETRVSPDIAQAGASVVNTIIVHFGWPGFLLWIGYRVLDRFSSVDQKHRLVEVFVFGSGIKQWWPILAVCILCVIAVFVEHGHGQKMLKTKQLELDRVTWERTELQRRLSPGADFDSSG